MSLDLQRKKGRFVHFKQSLEVHWLSISLGYNLPKAYWPLVRCSRLFSLPASFLFRKLRSSKLALRKIAVAYEMHLKIGGKFKYLANYVDPECLLNQEGKKPTT